MRTVVQLSDLHFGAILEPTLPALVSYLAALTPDLVIISGDFTQRATTRQFLDARAYLQQLPLPQLVVPGNHDVPLYNVIRRFASPFANYDRHISPNHNPSFVDSEIAVVALNSARSFTFKGGALSAAQVRAGTQLFDALHGNQVRIVVTHHPFDIPVGLSGVHVLGGAQAALQAFATCSVDVFLTGHLHLVHHANASVHVPGYHATLLGAGTATSSRARGEPNSFYLFRIDHMADAANAIVVETHTWQAAENRFVCTATRGLPRVSQGAGGVGAPVN